MRLGTRPRIFFHAAVVVRDSVVNLALNEHLLALLAVDTVFALVLVVEGDRCSVRRLVGAEGGRIPGGMSSPALRRAVAREPAGLAARSAGVDRRELDVAARAVLVVGALLRLGWRLVDGDEGPQARERRRHGAVADLQLCADDDEAQGDILLGG